jgi:hypothetical protein
MSRKAARILQSDPILWATVRAIWEWRIEP